MIGHYAPNVSDKELWTCPFCPLACDHMRVSITASGSLLQGGDCALARQMLAGFAAQASSARPELDGQPCTLDLAVSTAAAWLKASRQALFCGLGTDVAGARALYRLACLTGAISDAQGGNALMQGLRSLQDRGQFTTTLAEVRTRADLIVFLGGIPTDIAPLIGLRCGIGDKQVAQRHIVVLGPGPDDHATLAAWSQLPGMSVQALPLQGDLFDSIGLLLHALERAPDANAAGALPQLAQRLRAARYGVMVAAPARLPAHGELIIEAINQLVGILNRTTRAAALWVGGGNGSATVNQVFTWLSGLPLRSRAGPRGLEHEPHTFAADRLLADAAADSLLFLSSFDAQTPVPVSKLPMLVLGPPAMAAFTRRPGLPTLFIPVATPGVGAAGHLFRTDGTVLLPLQALYEDALPTAAAVLTQIAQSIEVVQPS